MKRALLLAAPLLLLALAGGALWWKYGRGGDPLAAAQAMMEKGNLQGALIELRSAVRRNPNDATAHFRLAQASQRAGDAVAAEKEYRAARDKGYDPRQIMLPLAQAYLAQRKYEDLLRDFPTTGLPAEAATPLLVMRTMAQLSLGDTKAAMASAEEAEKLSPRSADGPLAAARVFLDKRDYDSAQAKVDLALRLNPRSTDALLMRGQIYNLKGDHGRALDAFTAVLALAPGNLFARLERANLLILDGKDDLARADVDAALKIEPRVTMGYYLRGILEVRAKDYQAADADFTKLQSVLGRFPRGFYFYAIAKYNLGQAEQASEAASKFLARNPGNPDAIKLYCLIELASRRTAGPIRVLTEAQKSGYADAEMLDLLGQAYALSGKPGAALDTMERAATLAPNNADILARIASLRLSLGDAARAASDFEHVLDLSPQAARAAEQLVLASIAAGELDRATVGLQRLRKIQGDSETVGDLTARIRLANLDFTGAAAQLEETIKRFPDAIQARITLARVRLLQDRSADAEKLLAEVLDRRPAEGAALTGLVRLLNTSGQGQAALARLQAARKEAPNDASITVALASQLVHVGDSAKAAGVLDDALKAQPFSVTLLTAKARLLTQMGQPAAAEATWRKLLDEPSASTAARMAIADLLLAAKDPAGATTVLLTGLKATPGNPELLRAALVVALRSKGPEGALAMADQLAQDPANMPAAAWLRGDVMMATRRFADAEKAYGDAFRTYPGDDGLVRITGALSAAGSAEPAAKFLREWLDLHPGDPVAAGQLAGLDMTARRFRDAATHLQMLLAAKPSDSAALNNLAWVYLQLNDPRALAVAKKSYLLNPSPEASDTLGWVLVNTSDPATGLSLLRQAAALRPNDPSIAYHLAVAYSATGRKQEAIAALRPLVFSLTPFDERTAAERLYAQLARGG